MGAARQFAQEALASGDPDSSRLAARICASLGTPVDPHIFSDKAALEKALASPKGFDVFNALNNSLDAYSDALGLTETAYKDGKYTQKNQAWIRLTSKERVQEKLSPEKAASMRKDAAWILQQKSNLAQMVHSTTPYAGTGKPLGGFVGSWLSQRKGWSPAEQARESKMLGLDVPAFRANITDVLKPNSPTSREQLRRWFPGDSDEQIEELWQMTQNMGNALHDVNYPANQLLMNSGAPTQIGHSWSGDEQQQPGMTQAGTMPHSFMPNAGQ